MTGYVQRLVASTRAVRPAIRPTFGPGFGDLLDEGSPQVLPELETEETVLSRPAVSASGSYPQTQPPVGPKSEPATTSAAPLFPTHAVTTPTALSPNNPPASPELVAPFPLLAQAMTGQHRNVDSENRPAIAAAPSMPDKPPRYLSQADTHLA
jgi:hypothetical protein